MEVEVAQTPQCQVKHVHFELYGGETAVMCFLTTQRRLLYPSDQLSLAQHLVPASPSSVRYLPLSIVDMLGPN